MTIDVQKYHRLRLQAQLANGLVRAATDLARDADAEVKRRSARLAEAEALAARLVFRPDIEDAQQRVEEARAWVAEARTHAAMIAEERALAQQRWHALGQLVDSCREFLKREGVDLSPLVAPKLPRLPEERVSRSSYMAKGGASRRTQV